jgi:homoserine trans-succinylase
VKKATSEANTRSHLVLVLLEFIIIIIILHMDRKIIQWNQKGKALGSQFFGPIQMEMILVRMTPHKEQNIVNRHVSIHEETFYQIL